MYKELMTSHEEDRKYVLFNVTRSSWKAVIFFSHLCQPFILNYYIWSYAMNICINIDVETFFGYLAFWTAAVFVGEQTYY